MPLDCAFPELKTTRAAAAGGAVRASDFDPERLAQDASHALRLGQCTNPAQCTNCSPGNCGQCFGEVDSSDFISAMGEKYYSRAASS